MSEAFLTQTNDTTFSLRLEGAQQYPGEINAFTLPDRCKSIPTNSNQAVIHCDNTDFQSNDTITLFWDRNAVILNTQWGTGENKNHLILSNNGALTINISQLLLAEQKWHIKAKRYLLLGVEHILLGIDHLLFVLCLLLLINRTIPLIKTITGFSLGHSLTLAASYLGWLSLPIKAVEASIALSIAILAADILRPKQRDKSLAERFPWIVASGFGLLHGLGFASALQEINITQQEIPLALAFFNIGVETGQLLFIAALTLITSITLWMQKKLITPLSIQYFNFKLIAVPIGSIAMYWTLQRCALLI